MDGYSAVAASNWKRLKQITACFGYDKIGPVVILSLVAVNWPKSSEVKCSSDSNLKEDAQNIVSSRFRQQKEEEGGER